MRKELKRAKKKANKGAGSAQQINLIDDIMVLSAISSGQQAMLTTLTAPPIDPATNQPVTTLAPGTTAGTATYTSAEAAVLKWTANAARTGLISSYNITSAQRAEALMGFLANGLSPSSKKGGGLFGSGGISSLLIISSISGSSFSLGNLFGGSSTSGTMWGGLN